MRMLAFSATLSLVIVASAGGQGQSGHGIAFHGAQWINEGPSSGFYHAFLCIATRVGSGLKEDCYGFYPIDGTKAAVGGPGKIGTSDIRRVDSSVVSTRYLDITALQRSEVFAQLKDWESKRYQLNYSNCIDLMDRVAEKLGLKRPARRATQKPAEYVQALKNLNGL